MLEAGRVPRRAGLTAEAALLQVGLRLPPLDPALPGVDAVLALQLQGFGRNRLLGGASGRTFFSRFRRPLGFTTLKAEDGAEVCAKNIP